jgi:hypothetical protein
LKHPIAGLNRTRLARIRGACASASLKQGPSHLPSHDGRGIRGACASVSLKLRNNFPSNIGTFRIRGACASASLKPPGLAHLGAHRLGIRGACASASLKRLCSRLTAQHFRRIRGACASASLKHANHSLAAPPMRRHRRRMHLVSCMGWRGGRDLHPEYSNARSAFRVRRDLSSVAPFVAARPRDVLTRTWSAFRRAARSASTDDGRRQKFHS